MSALDGTSFRWLRTGNEAFAAMLQAIGHARSSIRLEMYIFTDSEIGRLFRDALETAARRGVRVTVMLDALGSFSLSSSSCVVFSNGKR